MLRRALAGAGRLVVTDNVTAYLILAIFAVIDGALMRNDTSTGRALLENAYPLTTWLMMLAFYFTLASAMRVGNPAYRMTLVSAFGVTISYVLFLIAVLAGLLCFVIPGIWIGTRLAFAPFCYALDTGDSPYSGLDAIASSWRLTGAHFWATFWLLALQAIVLALPLAAIELLALALFQRSHFSAYVTAPLILILTVYVLQVITLSMLEWASADF